MKVLVTGGAGYVGSVVSEELLREGHEVEVVDNLHQGHRQAVPECVEFFLADLCNAQGLDDIFQRAKVDAVMHLAAETVVASSVKDPGVCFQNNIVGGLNLLNAMVKHDVHKIIFSSSAAVYGEPESIPVDEEQTKTPMSSYGDSKLMFERILTRYGHAYQMKHISLRYFNAAGASEFRGEHHQPETHLIPNVLNCALGVSDEVSVFGDSYPTRDGSCIRDYIHVSDIARAHVLALQQLDAESGSAFNLGSEGGYSVFEIIECARKVTRASLPATVRARRPGDPAVLIASSKRARQELGWQPRASGLEDIIESAWKWTKEHPNGYA